MRMHGHSRMSRLRDRRGSIIVLVLVFVILLTFIVVAFLEEAASKIKYYGLFHNRDDLRTAHDSLIRQIEPRSGDAFPHPLVHETEGIREAGGIAAAGLGHVRPPATAAANWPTWLALATA